MRDVKERDRQWELEKEKRIKQKGNVREGKQQKKHQSSEKEKFGSRGKNKRTDRCKKERE